MNAKSRAFNTGFGPQVGEHLKRFDEFRSAVWVAAVINCIDSEKNVSRRNHFRPCKRISEKDGITGGNIGDRDALGDFCFRSLFRHITIIRERRTAEDAHVDLCDLMLFYS